MTQPHVANDKKQSNPEKESILHRELAYGITGKEWLASVTGGIISGTATLARLIHDYFRDDVKKATDFEAHFETRRNTLDAINFEDERKDGKKIYDLQTSEGRTAYSKAVSEKKHYFDTELRKALAEKRGIRKNPILGTFDRLSQLSSTSKSKLLFNTGVGAAVGAAMTLSFFNGVATRDRIERIEDAVTAKPNER